MYLRRSAAVKYFLAVFIGAAIYAEWLIYLIQPVYWKQHDCLDNDTTCTKILFIADPQIQGEAAVLTPMNYVANWDSDRYLKSTFTEVMKYFNPDVLVFLGDLMDDGSKATMAQFRSYVQRLADIFDVDDEILRVWVPGDNDIGGENEPVYTQQLDEFEKAFPQPPVLRFRNITFYKVNVITNTIPQSTNNDSTLNIVISHYPVLPKHQFSLNVEDKLNPDIYFCAHEHESKYMTQKKDRSDRHVSLFYDPTAILKLMFNGDLQTEVYVPTCSYRMGTSNIGYGAAVLDNNNQKMRYTVFWSSTRFPFIFSYLVILAIVLLYIFVFLLARLCYRCYTISIINADKQMSPLLQKI